MQRDLLLNALRLRGAATPDRLRREHSHTSNPPVLHWILRRARSRNQRHHCRHVPAVEDSVRDLHLGRVRCAGPACRRARCPGKRLAVDHLGVHVAVRVCARDAIFLMPETNPANILYRRARRLRKATGKRRPKSLSEIDAAEHTTRDHLIRLGRAFTLTLFGSSFSCRICASRSCTGCYICGSSRSRWYLAGFMDSILASRGWFFGPSLSLASPRSVCPSDLSVPV